LETKEESPTLSLHRPSTIRVTIPLAVVIAHELIGGIVRGAGVDAGPPEIRPERRERLPELARRDVDVAVEVEVDTVRRRRLLLAKSSRGEPEAHEQRATRELGERPAAAGSPRPLRELSRAQIALPS
jgi:hypothetical protein